MVEFSIEDNCYVKDKFIGTTVSKKITVNIINPNNEIDLENKEITAQTGMIINGKEEVIPFGNFIIEKPDTEEVKEKTSFTGYDYMVKFNIPYKNRVTYPIPAKELFEDLCNQAGLEVGNTDFTNANYMILGNPFTNNEDCRTVLSNIAQLAGGFAKIGRDNKVYIKSLKNISNLIKVKDVNAMTVKELNLTIVKMLSSGKDNADETLDGNNYLDDFTKNNKWGEVNSLILRISGTEGENTTIQDEESIQKNGLTELVIEDNYFLINQEEREKAITPLWSNLKGIEYLPFKTTYYGYPYLDSGDLIYIQDVKDIGYISYVFNHTFTFNGGYSGTLETTAMTKTQTAYKNTINNKTKFRHIERKIDKINGVIEDIIEEQTETTEKISEVEQTIDSITQTVSSVETKIETVEDKADNAQNTADSATQKAENAQTSANNAQSTANTANTNAQNAQKTADGAVTQITTTNQKVSQIEQTVSGITQSVSEVEERVETVETKADNAQSSANTANQNVEEVKKQTIYEVDVMYALSSSSTQAPTTGWSTTAPQWENGKYMWQKTVTTYGDGSKTESNATCITGAKGQDGANGTNGTDGEKGDTGIGVKSLVEQYYLSNSNTTQTGGSWKETQDKWTSGKYIWTRNKITWTDNSITYTTPILATGLNNANSVANTANNTANTANSTANTANNTANEAKNTADATNNNLTTNYYTKTETNSQINQKADSITSSVSKTYSTKTETANAKNEAINSANASTDKKLEDYTVTKQLGTVIEQNWEHVKVAWNQISDYIQMMIMDGTASLAILDQSGNIMMSLDKEGQNFYKSGQTTPFGEMGIKKVNNQNYISFSVLGKYGQTIQDGMAWGITIKDDNKFLPILYIKDFAVGNQGSETGSGKLVLNSCDIVLDNMGAGIEANNVKIHGDAMPGIFFTDIDTGKNLMSVTPDIGNVKYATISLLDSISFFKNQAGSNSLKIGNNSGSNYCLFSDDGSAIVKEIFVSSDGSSTNASGQFNFSSLPEYIGDPLVYGVGHKYHLEWAANKLFFYVDVTNVGTLSDKRLKTEIKDIDEDFINAIEEVEMKQFKVANRNGLISFGILAQDLMEIFEKYNKNPFDYEIVYETKYRTDDDTVYYAIDYTQFLVLKQKATDVKLKKLEEENKEKDKLLQDLIARVEKLEGGNK